MKKTAQAYDKKKWPDYDAYQKRRHDKAVELARKLVEGHYKKQHEWGLKFDNGRFANSQDKIDDAMTHHAIIRGGKNILRQRRGVCHDLAAARLKLLGDNGIKARRLFVDYGDIPAMDGDHNLGHSMVYFNGDDGKLHIASPMMRDRPRKNFGSFDDLNDAVIQYIAALKDSKRLTDDDFVEIHDTTDVPFKDIETWDNYRKKALKGKLLFSQKRAGARDFSGLTKLANIEKSAKSITRLLSRIGTDLAGATERDLKFLARRGFTGFDPGQVKSLRSQGFLPTIDQELAGFNRGTNNMLKFAPKSSTPNDFGVSTADPIRKITRTNRKGSEYLANLRDREVTIPNTDVKRTLSERERLATIARHEAREWVRGNAALAKGRHIGLPGGSFFPEVGTSHMPGVIHDERVFRSQLSNRLGLKDKWYDRPLVRDQLGNVLTRGEDIPRDAYVGSKPLKYEFDRIKEWNRMLPTQQRAIRKALETVPYSNEAERIYDEMMSDFANQRKNWMGGENNTELPRYLSKERPALRQLIIRSIIDNSMPQEDWSDIPRYIEPYYDRVTQLLERRTGIPFDDFMQIMGGSHVHAKPGGELEKVMNLSSGGLIE